MNGKISRYKSKLLMGVRILGIVIGLVIIVLGICTIKGKFGGNADIADSPSLSFDYGYATFGADFYTYLNNNSAYTAIGSQQTAYNLYTISKLLREVLGILLMAFGGFTVCLFSGKLVEAIPDEAAGTKAEDIGASEEDVRNSSEASSSTGSESTDCLR